MKTKGGKGQKYEIYKDFPGLALQFATHFYIPFCSSFAIKIVQNMFQIFIH